MPVPVPIHPRPSAHPVIKPTNNFQATLEPGQVVDPASSSKYVNHSPCQPTASLSGSAPLCISREARSNWSGGKLLHNPGHDSLFVFSLSGPRVVRESSSLQGGLITADNAVINKRSHAEACHSPVLKSESESWSSRMGLQHYGDRRDSSELVWSGYGMDDDAFVLSAPGAEVRDFGQPDAQRTSHGAGTVCFIREDKYNVFALPEQPADVIVGRDDTTPFADYVDQHASDHFIADAQAAVPPIDTPRRQQQPAAAEPLTDPAYIKAYRTMAETLSVWIADYVWKACTTGRDLPQRFVGVGTQKQYSEKPPSGLARSAHSLLCSTLLQPSAVVLSLWYITRLPVFFGGEVSGADMSSSERDFRMELFGEGRFFSSGERSILEARAPFRVILLGCMLANKWLDDHTFSNKTWQSISEIPIHSINCLELSALAVLGHDLSVTPKAWERWLSHLYRYQSSPCPYPAPIRRPSTTDSNLIIRKMIEDLAYLHVRAGPKSEVKFQVPQPVFCPLFDGDNEKSPVVERVDMFDPYEIDLDEDGPLREEYIPKRRTSHSRSQSAAHTRGVPDVQDILQMQTSPLPPPSEWSPQADPPLDPGHRHRDGYFAAPPGSGLVSHGHNLTSEHTERTTWGSQAVSGLSGLSFQSHRADLVQPSSVFQSLTLGFPFSSVCPPISHARSTLAAAPAQFATNLRCCQPSCSDGYCLPSVSGAHYVGYPSAFPHVQGNSTHFQPQWLRA
ncbi:hypothetical protein M0805_007466 [Coniferiporia weirii]|nr:hypothetical protein M0805_007466 [Coniferiporia weirii]